MLTTKLPALLKQIGDMAEDVRLSAHRPVPRGLAKAGFVNQLTARVLWSQLVQPESLSANYLLPASPHGLSRITLVRGDIVETLGLAQRL